MEKQGEKLIAEFYRLFEEWKGTDLVQRPEFDKLLEEKLIPDHPEVALLWCDNSYFASSLLIILPLDEVLVSVFFLDQFESDRLVRLNFSPYKWNQFKKVVLQLDLPD